MKCAQHVFFGQHVFSWSTFSNLVNLVQFGQRCDILWFGLVLYGLDGFECTPVCGEGQELLGQLKKQKMYLNRGSWAYASKSFFPRCFFLERLNILGKEYYFHIPWSLSLFWGNLHFWNTLCAMSSPLEQLGMVSLHPVPDHNTIFRWLLFETHMI